MLTRNLALLRNKVRSLTYGHSRAMHWRLAFGGTRGSFRRSRACCRRSDRSLEYHNKIITKLFGGSPRLGCYGLAVTIFSLGIFRDYLYVCTRLPTLFIRTH